MVLFAAGCLLFTVLPPGLGSKFSAATVLTSVLNVLLFEVRAVQLGLSLISFAKLCKHLFIIDERAFLLYIIRFKHTLQYVSSLIVFINYTTND